MFMMNRVGQVGRPRGVVGRSRVEVLLGLAVVAMVGCGASSGPVTQPVPSDRTAVPSQRPVALEPTAGAAALAPSPAAAPHAAAVEPVASGRADLDPSNDNMPGPPPPIEDCEAQLRSAGITFKAARIGTSREVEGVPRCGSEQVVRYKRGPGVIAYSSAPLLTCTMALALADFERIAQEEADREFGSPIVKIEHLGTFNCRKMALYDLVSEHSYANALDVRRILLKDGRKIDVLTDFRPAESDAPDPRTRFLRKLSNRLFDENIFSVVITPYFDSAHRNHLHVDLARYRVDGSRP